MLDIKIIRENPEKVNELLKKKPRFVDWCDLEIDVQRRKIQTEADELRVAKKNNFSRNR